MITTKYEVRVHVFNKGCLTVLTADSCASEEEVQKTVRNLSKNLESSKANIQIFVSRITQTLEVSSKLYE